MRAALLLALTLAVTALAASPAPATAEPIAPDRIRVLDGDTIRLDGGPDVRLVGFNTPETNGAQCPAERGLGFLATRRLRELVSGGGLDLQTVRCACPPGTEGTASCNYGRSCAVLKARGEDVAAVLIREGLAVPFYCSGTGCTPTPRPWCG